MPGTGWGGTFIEANIGHGTIGGGTIGDPTGGVAYSVGTPGDLGLIDALTASPAGFPSPILEWSPTTGPFDTPVWENITRYMRDGRSRRGRSGEFDNSTAGELEVTLSNADRTFDPEFNPDCRPRKQIRAYTGYGNTGLVATGSLSGAWTSMTSTYTSSADLDVRVKVALADWTAADFQILMSAQTFNYGNYGCWAFGVTPTGGLVMSYTTAGTVGTTVARTSTATTGFANGATRWCRVTHDADNGSGQNEVKFYTSTDATDDPADVASWTQLGSTVTNAGVATMWSTGLVVGVAAAPDNTYNAVGTFYSAGFSKVVGSVQAVVDFTDPAQFAPYADQGTDSTGQKWFISHGPNQPDGLSGAVWAVWQGWIDDLPQQYELGGDTLVNLTASDGFWIAEQHPMRDAYTEVVKSHSPSLWLRLDDRNRKRRPVAVDSSGHDNHGTYYGRPTATEDPLVLGGEQALEFDADENDRVLVASQANVTTAPFTVEAWVQSGTVTVNRTAEIVCQSYDTSTLGTAAAGGVALGSVVAGDLLGGVTCLLGAGFEYQPGLPWALAFELAQEASTNFPRFAWTSDTGTTSTATGYASIAPATALSNPVRHLVGVVDTDRRARLYVDGQPVATGDAASTAVIAGSGATGRIRLASPPSTVDDTVYRRWNGILDEVAAYPAALTPAQVLSHYNAGIDGWEGDLPGTRIGRILDIVGWPTNMRDLDTGASKLQGGVGTSSALDHILAVNETERGRVFCTADGKFAFRGRHAELTDPRSTTVQASFVASDYNGIGFDYGAKTLVNDVTVTPNDGTEQRLTDETSVDAYGTQQLSISGTLQDEFDALALCQWGLLHYADPLLRTSDLVVTPMRDPSTLIAAVLDLELGDRVSVTKTLPGADITVEAIVEGVTHRWSVDDTWRTEFKLSPANTLTGFMVVGDATTGKVDTGRVCY